MKSSSSDRYNALNQSQAYGKIGVFTEPSGQNGSYQRIRGKCLSTISFYLIED